MASALCYAYFTLKMKVFGLKRSQILDQRSLHIRIPVTKCCHNTSGLSLLLSTNCNHYEMAPSTQKCLKFEEQTLRDF